MTETTRHRSMPWGRTAGLLAACLATLIGVCSGLDPDVVLLRAATAGIVVGLVGAVVTSVWQWWMQQETGHTPATRKADQPRWSEIAATTGKQDVAGRRKAE